MRPQEVNKWVWIVHIALMNLFGLNQDRGMMKWAAFATAELTEAQKKFLEKELNYPIDSRTVNFKNEKRV